MKLGIRNIKEGNINHFSLNKVVDKYFYLMYHDFNITGYTELIKTDELLIFRR